MAKIRDISIIAAQRRTNILANNILHDICKSENLNSEEIKIQFPALKELRHKGNNI
jgi:hypothetical protein